MQQDEATKPFYDSKFMFSRVMNRSVKHACRKRLEILLKDEENTYEKWQDQHRRLINKTRQEMVERNFLKRISALRIVCWMLSDMGNRSPDLPPLVVKRKKDLTPKKERKLLPASSPAAEPVISQDNLNMLVNLAKVLNLKNS